MIHRIYSDLPKFKNIELHGGLNILIAEKSEGATQGQTRNRAGKSSVVEILHFLLGADANKTMFVSEPLASAKFGIRIDIAGKTAVIERSGAEPNRIDIIDADTVNWSKQPAESDGKRQLSLKDWKTVIGAAMFGLTAESDVKTRAILPYFIRRQDGGFLSPTQSREGQTVGEKQIALTYLFGLDTSIPVGFEDIRKREKKLLVLQSELRKIQGSKTTKAATGQLRSDLAVAENKASQLRTTVSSFRVLPEFEKLEKEASVLTRRISALSNENTAYRDRISLLTAALETEKVPDSERLKMLYEEAGVLLPERVTRRFEDVAAFHQSVVKNRQSYLKSELAKNEERLAKNITEQSPKEERLATIMSILNGHGALEQYSKLQSELNRIESDVAAIKRDLERAQGYEQEKSQLQIDRNKLYLRLQQDYQEQAQQLTTAIQTFENISGQLYEEGAGHLNITESESGPVFEVVAHGDESKGIGNMQIFCFDMTVAAIASKRGIHPGFLVHDSMLFDGVDSRQVARALSLGAKLADEHGFQYFVSLNSDALPSETVDGFDISKHILPVRLTDATEDGGLFGFRFDW